MEIEGTTVYLRFFTDFRYSDLAVRFGFQFFQKVSLIVWHVVVDNEAGMEHISRVDVAETIATHSFQEVFL